MKLQKNKVLLLLILINIISHQVEAATGKQRVFTNEIVTPKEIKPGDEIIINDFSLSYGPIHINIFSSLTFSFG